MWISWSSQLTKTYGETPKKKKEKANCKNSDKEDGEGYD
jgi:hypothetical protein